jgi:hypothetical protein
LGNLSREASARSIEWWPAREELESAGWFTDPFDGFLVKPVVQSDLFDCLAQLFEDRVSMPRANGHAKTEDNRTGSESPWPRTLTAPEMEAAEQTQQSVAAQPNGTDGKPQPTQVDESR